MYTYYKIISKLKLHKDIKEKWIYRLKTLALLGLNTEICNYAKECTISTNSVIIFVISFNITFT